MWPLWEPGSVLRGVPGRPFVVEDGVDDFRGPLALVMPLVHLRGFPPHAEAFAQRRRGRVQGIELRRSGGSAGPRSPASAGPRRPPSRCPCPGLPARGSSRSQPGRSPAATSAPPRRAGRAYSQPRWPGRSSRPHSERRSWRTCPRTPWTWCSSSLPRAGTGRSRAANGRRGTPPGPRPRSGAAPAFRSGWVAGGAWVPSCPQRYPSIAPHVPF